MRSGVLGYGGALLLVAIAVAILIDAAVAGPKNGGERPMTRRHGATDSASSGSASSGSARPDAQVGPTGTSGQAGRPGLVIGGTDRCAAESAFYRRSGDTVRVTVNFPGSGYVAAFVEVIGQETMTKSATNTGRPQTFEFTAVPKELTRRIGVTVITQASLRTCDVRAAN